MPTATTRSLPANVGNSTIKGAELETEIHPVDNMLIDASASYVDFSYDSVDRAAVVLLSDKPPFARKTKYSVGAQYEIHLGEHGSLTPRIDCQYQARQYSYARNFPNDRIPPYGLANARLTYPDSSRRRPMTTRWSNRAIRGNSPSPSSGPSDP